MNWTQFKDNLLVTICLIAYILQPSIVKSTLQLFKYEYFQPQPLDLLYLDVRT